MHNAPSEPITSTDPNGRSGVTASGTPWRIRYDPTARFRAQEKAEREARAIVDEMAQRREELELLRSLAEKHGMVLRPALGRPIREFAAEAARR